MMEVVRKGSGILTDMTGGKTNDEIWWAGWRIWLEDSTSVVESCCIPDLGCGTFSWKSVEVHGLFYSIRTFRLN